MTSNSKRVAAILVPVFALRSKNDLGIGDVESMQEMIDWCALHRFSILQILPINETGDDNSPYNAISSLALEPSTIAISPKLIPELSEEAFKAITAKHEIEKLRTGPVQYRKVKALKLELLRAAFQSFTKSHDFQDTGPASQFRKFLADNGNWISDYALFRALMDYHKGLQVWEKWPAEHQTPAQAREWIHALPAEEQKQFEESILFFSYVQWIAYQQWKTLKEYGGRKNVGLMGDIPFGISRYSSDVWASRDLFDLKWSCGAPPETFYKIDPFVEKWGQNWGIVLYRWNRMKEDGYRWWKDRVGGVKSVFHYFRIDHVLGFYRIYGFPWKPEDNHIYTYLSHDEVRAKVGDLPRFWPENDDTDEHKKVNHYNGEELLGMVLDTAGETRVIAEDLGVVPEYVRPSLTQMGIPGFKIPMFERNQDGSYKNSDEYPFLSVITFATHDHEPMAAIWKRWDTVPEGVNEKKHLLRWIGWNPEQIPGSFTPELHSAIVGKILNSPSWIAIFMITDLLGGTQRFNVPGPMSDSNWTERLECPASEFDQRKEIASKVQTAERLIRTSGR